MGSKKKMKQNNKGLLATISNSSLAKKGKQAARDTSYVATRLMRSTGKAAWIAATTLLVLGLPLLIVRDREAQLDELDLQQQTLLGVPPAASSMGAQTR